eukprot:TRINITY_DN6148_c1_g1_i1.p1 TRINITY_DN6148_c1_g1~~TRINITY_DN6148_c1_g1_i1.p1  ORF type:complete len:151 (+),score=29.91 TRINITY_DN6148_c1_g1_i1:66-518(+)
MTTFMQAPQVSIDTTSAVSASSAGDSSAPVSPSLSASSESMSSSMCSRSSRSSLSVAGQDFVQSKNATRVRFSRKVKKYSYRSAQFVLPKPTTTDELWEHCIAKAQELMKTSGSLQSFVTDDETANEKVAIEVAKVIYAKEVHKSNLSIA